MRSYRIFILDDKGRTISGSDLRCPSDQDARARAEITLKAGEAAVIWDGSRLISRIPALQLSVTL